MWKLIIILVLVIYVLNKVSVLLFRMSGRAPQTPPNFRRSPEGGINVDGMTKKPNRKGGLKGGEYVDYEEVK